MDAKSITRLSTLYMHVGAQCTCGSTWLPSPRVRACATSTRSWSFEMCSTSTIVARPRRWLHLHFTCAFILSGLTESPSSFVSFIYVGFSCAVEQSAILKASPSGGQVMVSILTESTCFGQVPHYHVLWSSFRASRPKRSYVFHTVQRRQQKLWVTGEDWKAGDKGVLVQKSVSTTMMREHIRRVHDIDVGLRDSKKKPLWARREKSQTTLPV